MLLQPTSPLRRVKDIKATYDLIKKNNLNSLISISNRKNNPHELKSNLKYFYNNKLKNSDYSKEKFYLNGAIYVFKTAYFLKNKTFYDNRKQHFYFMPSRYSLDIDTKKDIKKYK